MKNIVTFIVILLLTIQKGLCAGEEPQIIMSSDKKGTVKIELAGSGTATIDWGDNSDVQTVTLSEKRSPITHGYIDKTIRTITIWGESITEFSCEICEIKTLDVSNNPTLTFLHCGDNPQLNKIDISKNVALKYLDCYNSGLTYLDVSNNIDLQKLYCYGNRITQLDVNNNTKLTHLICSANYIAYLDVSNNLELQSLNCRSNELTCLDVSNNVDLQHLECNNRGLTHVDVSKNIKLKSLVCSGNMKSIDVSKNIELEWLSSEDGQLKRLNVSKNNKLRDLNCANNKFSASALNALFKSLPVNDTTKEKEIIIGGNPGTNKCKTRIAEKKGWTINYQSDFG